ncbi:ribonuclease P protein component [Saccharopolyspora sp. MS10]|uniref:ribonuclease P protein component n=1 Tax=Saccharopolyspora sp. MS10 TaxID=3385973 RepID=UPI0039A04FB5
MLPAAARLTSSQEFRLAVRRGRRAGRTRLVVHLLMPNAATRPLAGDAATGAGRSTPGTAQQEPAAGSSAEVARASSGLEPTRESGEPARVGFVVSKAVGNAVLRHRVTRRLRHLVRDRLDLLPTGTLVVVRALPPAASASSRDLGSDLDAALRKLRLARPGGPVTGSG